MRNGTLLSVLVIVLCVACGDKKADNSSSAGTGSAGTGSAGTTAGTEGAAGSGTAGTGAGTTAGNAAGAGAGTSGEAGTDGSAGTSGEAGTDGSAGTDGKAGTGGDAGTSGEAGTGGTESNDCCTAHSTPGCRDDVVETCVCALLPDCCENVWDGACAQIVTEKYCQPDVRDCVCGTGEGQWAQATCCETSWTNFCDVTAVNKCGAEAGCH